MGNPQMESAQGENDIPKDFHVRVLGDGKIIYGCGIDDEVSYDSIDQLFNGMKPDLESAIKDSGTETNDISERKKNVGKMMGDNSNEE